MFPTWKQRDQRRAAALTCTASLSGETSAPTLYTHSDAMIFQHTSCRDSSEAATPFAGLARVGNSAKASCDPEPILCCQNSCSSIGSRIGMVHYISSSTLEWWRSPEGRAQAICCPMQRHSLSDDICCRTGYERGNIPAHLLRWNCLGMQQVGTYLDTPIKCMGELEVTI